MKMTTDKTIRALERQLGEHAEEMIRLSRAHARGESVAVDKMRTQAAIDVVTAIGRRIEARRVALRAIGHYRESVG